MCNFHADPALLLRHVKLRYCILSPLGLYYFALYTLRRDRLGDSSRMTDGKMIIMSF